MRSQPLVYIVTYGCKVNYYESEAVASLLSAWGIANRMVADGAISRLPHAAAFVVNSCAVTSMAEKKSRYGVSKIKKYHTAAPIVTMGCAMGRKTPEQVALEVTQRLQLPAGTMTPTVWHQREKAFVKVQDGCQNFCSYCIIPYKRHQLSHRPIAEVVAEINAQGSHVTEIVLCGINLCYYPDFAALCRAVDSCGRKWQISSMEPPLLTPELLNTLASCVNFQPNFHVCLQSGSDQVLHDMNRHYTTAAYEQIITMIRDQFPNAFLATDIIVGYPTETAAEFQKTYNFLKKMRFDKIHLFPYSPRPGTAAAALTPITNAVVTARLKILQAL